MAKTRYVAIRACYYGPPGYRTLFKPGDYLPENWEPGAHFVREGEEPIEITEPARSPGDDPRSTKQIKLDLLSTYPDWIEKNDFDLPNATRKELFMAWKEAEAGEDPQKYKATEPETSGDPLEGRKFFELEDEDIKKFKAQELISSLKERFQLDMSFAGKSKKELIQLGCELEAKQLGARAP